jgi:hypothetical protein
VEAKGEVLSVLALQRARACFARPQLQSRGSTLMNITVDVYRVLLDLVPFKLREASLSEPINALAALCGLSFLWVPLSTSERFLSAHSARSLSAKRGTLYTVPTRAYSVPNIRAGSQRSWSSTAACMAPPPATGRQCCSPCQGR